MPRGGWTMKIENCEFPDSLLYEDEGFVWARPEPSGEFTVGATSIQVALAGRLTKIAPKPLGAEYGRGKSLGSIESGKYFGAIRAPFDGVLVAVNESVVRRPRLLSADPYGDGWYARLRPKDDSAGATLRPPEELQERFVSQIAALRVHCFAAFPDYEMFEIGTECAAVLVKLDELIAHAGPGEVVHIVSDDWTAPAEMENWSVRTGHPVVESRKEGSLYHFLVRKVA